MKKNKAISFDIRAEFGMLRKPFSNEKMDLYLTFNMLHKPALLGILGAILGLKGFRKYGVLPEYYTKLKDLKIGIEPIKEFHERGIFQKTNIKYKNGVGYASKEDGGNLLIHEQTLINPGFRCYILLDGSINSDLEKQLEYYLKDGLAEYIPYLGKNEFSVWFQYDECSESFTSDYIATDVFTVSEDFEISSIFSVGDSLFKDEMGESIFSFIPVDFYSYFERLPFGYHPVENTFQYKLKKYVFTNSPVTKDTSIPNLYQLTDSQNSQKYVQFN